MQVADVQQLCVCTCCSRLRDQSVCPCSQVTVNDVMMTAMAGSIRR